MADAMTRQQAELVIKNGSHHPNCKALVDGCPDWSGCDCGHAAEEAEARMTLEALNATPPPVAPSDAQPAPDNAGGAKAGADTPIDAASCIDFQWRRMAIAKMYDFGTAGNHESAMAMLDTVINDACTLATFDLRVDLAAEREAHDATASILYKEMWADDRGAYALCISCEWVFDDHHDECELAAVLRAHAARREPVAEEA